MSPDNPANISLYKVPHFMYILPVTIWNLKYWNTFCVLSQARPSERNFIAACPNSIHSLFQRIICTFAILFPLNSTSLPAQKLSTALGGLHDKVDRPQPDIQDAHVFTRCQRSNLFTMSCPLPTSHIFLASTVSLKQNQYARTLVFLFFVFSTSLHKLCPPFKVQGKIILL